MSTQTLVRTHDQLTASILIIVECADTDGKHVGVCAPLELIPDHPLKNRGNHFVYLKHCAPVSKVLEPFNWKAKN